MRAYSGYGGWAGSDEDCDTYRPACVAPGRASSPGRSGRRVTEPFVSQNTRRRPVYEV
jgi:hypothetical protein